MRYLKPLISCILFCLVSLSSYALDNARADEIISTYVDKQEFMGSVLVTEGDDIVFSKSYGLANAEWDIPNTPTTKFRLGSVTKQFTAAVILQLEERGKLSTSDLISKHIPDIPDTWKDITIFHLLTHSAGIFNVTSLPDFSDHSIKAKTAKETLALVTDLPLDFIPGEEMRYSNAGYIALGYIVELVSGQAYPEYVREHLFKPLNINDSGYDSNTDIIKNRAMGYSNSPKGIMLNSDYVHMSIPHGAGALYSTTEDLARWNNGLYGGKLLSKASLEKMTTPYKNNYAFGIGVQESSMGINYSHGGGIQGFNTFLIYYPETKTTVVALSNLNGNAPSVISTNLAKLVYGEKVV